tara:strand:- start:920 stop:1870 length:951 start_codon:yes stop_codon:yes gene_type:complete
MSSVCNITVDLTHYILGNTEWQHGETTASNWLPEWDIHVYNWSRWETLASIVQVSTCEEKEKICGPVQRIKDREVLEPEQLYGGRDILWPHPTPAGQRMQKVCQDVSASETYATVNNSWDKCQYWTDENCTKSAGCMKDWSTARAWSNDWGQGRCQKQCPPQLIKKDTNTSDVVNFILKTIHHIFDHTTNVTSNASKDDLRYVGMRNIPVEWLHVDDDIFWLYDDNDNDPWYDHTDNVATWHTGLTIVGEPLCTELTIATTVPMVSTVTSDDSTVTDDSTVLAVGIVVVFVAICGFYFCSNRSNKRKERRFETNLG